MKSNEELSFSSIALNELLQVVHSKGATFRFQATGFSMSPFIKDGDIITVSPLSDSCLDSGEIAAFIHPDTEKLIIHRLISRKGGYYLAKGDSVSSTDGFIPRERILGCVTKIERNNRDIRFGFGLERLIISFLSRKRLLPLFFWGWRRIPFSIRRVIKCRLL